MPTSLPRITRRAALAGAVVAGTAACSPYTVDEPSPRLPHRPRGTDPDVALAATVLADEQALLDLVEATLDRHPRLERDLTDVREVHRAHIALLTDAVPDGATASPSSVPSPGVTPRHGVPGNRRKALAALAGAEEDLSLVDKRSAFAAESGAFARVLAGMAAAAAQQAVLVPRLAATGADR